MINIYVGGGLLQPFVLPGPAVPSLRLNNSIQKGG